MITRALLKRLRPKTWLLVVSLAGCGEAPAPPAKPASTNAGRHAVRENARADETPRQDSRSASPAAPENITGGGVPSSGDTLIDTTMSGDGLQDLPEDIETLALGANDRSVTKKELAAERARLDQTVWQREVMAQEHERAFVRLWDKLLHQRRTSGDPLAVLRDVVFDSITVGQVVATRTLDHGISVMSLSEWKTLGRDQWRRWVDGFREEGYRLVQSEWHHSRFYPQSNGSARSTVSMALYVEHPQTDRRLVISGDVDVVWRPERDEQGIPIAQHVDASRLQIASRFGPTGFEKLLTVDHAGPDNRSGVQPILVYDLNRDGLSEVMLVGSNELLWNEGQGKFTTAPLCAHPERGFETGIVADFTGDGHVDLLLAGLRGDLLLYPGQQDGFTQPPIGKARGGGPLVQPQVMTAGDIDHDGDLDLWVGQYKISYVGGQMPTPYFDANDGFPAYLLLNDGQGRFSPFTEEAGLAEKRNRRSYGGSFIDIDVDGDLDLVVVSDFAGVDLYENDGTGYFRDVTDDVIDDRHLFGMSSAFADFNLDGRLDFFVTGMASTTARRLEYMKLGRRDRPEVHRMRSRMGYGNRMYLAEGNRFRQPTFRDQVARTGWSWGSTAMDFDNDGDKDLFVANGHSSGESTKDHCTHFWCHDIYQAGSQPNQAVHALFQDVLQGYFDRSESWDGYQKNVLLMNQHGQGFENIAFLMGVGHDYDGRAVVSDDLDADGRVDLLVVEDRWNEGQRLHIYRNTLQTDHHWIGVRLHDLSNGKSVLGCRVTVQTPNQTYTSHIISGDSIHAQHAAVAHFGLGDDPQIDAIEVQWIDGHKERLTQPQANRYHTILRDP